MKKELELEAETGCRVEREKNHGMRWIRLRCVLCNRALSERSSFEAFEEVPVLFEVLARTHFRDHGRAALRDHKAVGNLKKIRALVGGIVGAVDARSAEFQGEVKVSAQPRRSKHGWGDI
jgi:hypothetical protein